MRDGQVILFRRHGEFLLGRYIQGPPGKIQVSLEPGRVVRINPQQVVTEMDVTVEESTFPEWRRRHESLAQQIDLKEVWELVQGEVPRLTLEQMTELLWGASPDAMHQAALQVHLSIGSPYFALHGDDWVPSPPQEVEAQHRQQEQQRAAEEDREAFVSWLAGQEAPDAWTPRQMGWLEHLRQFAIHGDAHTGSGTARQLLRQVQPKTSDWQRLAFDLLVQRGIFQEDEPLGLHRRGVSTEFSADALEESRKVALQGLLEDASRRDLTGWEMITIDEASTRDIDDGLSLQETDQGFLLGVHIADVSALVSPDGALDQEASSRMTSLYLPETTLPMLPSRVSEELGSLVPDNPRLALSLLIQMDQAFRIDHWEVVPSVVRSQVRLSYDEVDGALEEEKHPRNAMLSSLAAIAQSFRSQRMAAGALELNRSELKVHVDPDGRISVSVGPPPTPARRLVAEFMIQTNRLLGEFCRDHDVPAVFRSQEAADLDDLAEVSNETVWTYRVMRRLRPGDLDVEPRPHASLGLPVYLQATSPLRRYPDLVMQRQVAHFLREGNPLYERDTLAQVIYRAEEQLRDLARLEEERKRYWLLKYLRTRLGETFQGVVLEVRNHETLVELTEYPLRVRLYLFHTLEPGEVATMRLEEVDLWRLTPSFIHLSDAE